LAVQLQLPPPLPLTAVKGDPVEGEPLATVTAVMSPVPIAGLLAMRDQSTFPLSSITIVVPTL
jgi:hypothetical protein